MNPSGTMRRVSASSRSETAYICGVDEAGRGSLAGPLFAAAVVLDPCDPIDGLKDSKALSPGRREALEAEVKRRALAFGIAWATAKEIDDRGIDWANRIAFTRAIRDLLRRFPHVSATSLVVLIDGTRPAIRLGMRQETVVGGDRSEPAIAAASILAKTARDRYAVEEMHRRFPQYGFDRHKGYGTREHLASIERWGPSALHRMSFKPRLRARTDAGDMGGDPGARELGDAAAPGGPGRKAAEALG